MMTQLRIAQTACNNNGACEAGEDCSSCPADCPALSGASDSCGAFRLSQTHECRCPLRQRSVRGRRRRDVPHVPGRLRQSCIASMLRKRGLLLRLRRHGLLPQDRLAYLVLR
jgi:hypothetical protein